MKIKRIDKKLIFEDGEKTLSYTIVKPEEDECESCKLEIE